MKGPLRVFLGWDVREMIAWNVAAATLRQRTSSHVDVHRLAMQELRARGLYIRPTTYGESGGYFDKISGAPMATGHAITRFLVPALCQYAGWALFCDGDVLFRADIADLFDLADDRYAVQVVQHDYHPNATTKMDGQVQTIYLRKNWSSVVLWNCGHPAHRALTVERVNSVPGRDLHRFDWLTDDLIGALATRWNWLAGHSSMEIDPAIVHFTAGVPDMPGWEHQPYADEWYAAARSCGYHLMRPARAEAVMR